MRHWWLCPWNWGTVAVLTFSKCPCPKFSFHTLTPVTHNRSTSASISATLLTANGKHWQSHLLSKEHLWNWQCKNSVYRSPDFSFTDPPNPNSVDKMWMLNRRKELVPRFPFLNSSSYAASQLPIQTVLSMPTRAAGHIFHPQNLVTWDLQGEGRN